MYKIWQKNHESPPLQVVILSSVSFRQGQGEHLPPPLWNLNNVYYDCCCPFKNSVLPPIVTFSEWNPAECLQTVNKIKELFTFSLTWIANIQLSALTTLQVYCNHFQYYMLHSVGKARMKLRGSTVVIICCLLAHFSTVITEIFLLTGVKSMKLRVSILCFQGLMFLVYPLLGHLADVYLTRYHTLKCGLVILVTGWLWMSFFSITNTILSCVQNNHPTA